MDVNDGMRFLDERGALRFFASRLAMLVNDETGCLTPRGDLRFFASRLAPTGFRVGQKICGRSITPV